MKKLFLFLLISQTSCPMFKHVQQALERFVRNLDKALASNEEFAFFDHLPPPTRNNSQSANPNDLASHFENKKQELQTKALTVKNNRIIIQLYLRRWADWRTKRKQERLNVLKKSIRIIYENRALKCTIAKRIADKKKKNKVAKIKQSIAQEFVYILTPSQSTEKIDVIESRKK